LGLSKYSQTHSAPPALWIEIAVIAVRPGVEVRLGVAVRPELM